MAKKIILVRHAKSDWSVLGQKDFDRTLNQRGMQDAPRMGNALKNKNLVVDLIIASPAIRAKTTAEFIAEQIAYDVKNIKWVDDLYEASTRTILGEINNLENHYNTVIIVGHNPSFTHMAEYFTKAEINNMPTCSMVGITFEVDNWQLISGQTGNLDFFIYPKMLFDDVVDND